MIEKHEKSVKTQVYSTITIAKERESKGKEDGSVGLQQHNNRKREDNFQPLINKDEEKHCPNKKRENKMMENKKSKLC